MKDGRTQNFDFRRVGLPLAMICFGKKTRAEILEELNKVVKHPIHIKKDLGFN